LIWPFYYPKLSKNLGQYSAHSVLKYEKTIYIAAHDLVPEVVTNRSSGYFLSYYSVTLSFVSYGCVGKRLLMPIALNDNN